MAAPLTQDQPARAVVPTSFLFSDRRLFTCTGAILEAFPSKSPKSLQGRTWRKLSSFAALEHSSPDRPFQVRCVRKQPFLLHNHRITISFRPQYTVVFTELFMAKNRGHTWNKSENVTSKPRFGVKINRFIQKNRVFHFSSICGHGFT